MAPKITPTRYIPCPNVNRRMPHIAKGQRSVSMGCALSDCVPLGSWSTESGIFVKNRSNHNADGRQPVHGDRFWQPSSLATFIGQGHPFRTQGLCPRTRVRALSLHAKLRIDQNGLVLGSSCEYSHRAEWSPHTHDEEMSRHPPPDRSQESSIAHCFDSDPR